jgi:flagellar basal-body rod protein FlgC
MALGTFSAMEVAASGLSAERSRMNTIASNLANAKTTRTDAGGPYKRIDPVFSATPIHQGFSVDSSEQNVQLVKIDRIAEDTRDPMKVYEPGHPDADATGYVSYPNVNVVEEMVNMITASRAYEAGVSSIESVKAMAQSALGLGK